MLIRILDGAGAPRAIALQHLHRAWSRGVIRIRNWMVSGALLAALGLISPLIAAVVTATSSLLVAGNSLRLRR